MHQTSNQDFPINSSHPPCGSFGFYGLWKVAKKCGMGRCQTWNSPISQNGFTNFPKNGTQQFQPKINNSNLPGKWDWSVANHLGPKPPTPSRLKGVTCGRFHDETSWLLSIRAFPPPFKSRGMWQMQDKVGIFKPSTTVHWCGFASKCHKHIEILDSAYPVPRISSFGSGCT